MRLRAQLYFAALIVDTQNLHEDAHHIPVESHCITTNRSLPHNVHFGIKVCNMHFFVYLSRSSSI